MEIKDYAKVVGYFDQLFSYLDEKIAPDDLNYDKFLLLKEKTQCNYMHYENLNADYIYVLSESLNMTDYFSIFGYDVFIMAMRYANGGDIKNKYATSSNLNLSAAFI